MAETCKWLEHAGNGSDSLAKDTFAQTAHGCDLQRLPGQHHQAAEQAANEQARDRGDQSVMIPARKVRPGQIQ
jgi:hypothetical protein